MNETQGGVRRDTILDRYSIEPLDSLFCTPAEETALLIKLRRKVILYFMCRPRTPLPRAALVSLPHRRRITLNVLLFHADAARTVLFLIIQRQVGATARSFHGGSPFQPPYKMQQSYSRTAYSRWSASRASN